MAQRPNGEIVAAGDGRIALVCGKVPLTATGTMFGSGDGTILAGRITDGPESVIGRTIEIFTTDNLHGIINIKRS